MGGPVRRALSLLALFSPLVACAVRSAGGEPARLERRVAAMGTAVGVVVDAPDRGTALPASERAVRAIEAAEARLSTWRKDTELARLNAAAVGERVPLSPALSAELAEAARWSRETEGAFDPGCGALVEAWGLRSGGRVPSAEEVRAACASGIRDLELGAGFAVRRRSLLRVEEGGWGKGAGLDGALRALEGSGATRATIDLGGQVAFFGRGPFTVGIAAPDRRAEPVLEARLDGGSLATSGNREKRFEVDGRLFGHLLDPRTGEPAPDFGSLSVWASSALAADCLSTGLYVLGPEAALEWARAHPGVEVLVLETTETGLRARATAGFEGRLRPLSSDLRLEFVPALEALRGSDAP